MAKMVPFSSTVVFHVTHKIKVKKLGEPGPQRQRVRNRQNKRLQFLCPSQLFFRSKVLPIPQVISRLLMLLKWNVAKFHVLKQKRVAAAMDSTVAFALIVWREAFSN